MLNKMQFMSMLQFKGGMPSIIFRDEAKGRISAHKAGEFLGTILPSGEFFDGGPDDCEWISADCNTQHRVSYGDLAIFFSLWQQTGLQDKAEDEMYESREYRQRLGF